MLIALLLFAAAFLLAAVYGRSLRHTLPLTVTSAALVVYGCTYLNHKSAAYLVLGLALAVLAVLAAQQARNKQLALPPAGQALLFLGLILLLWAATRNWVPAFVDDRNHWAVFPAQMIAVERFPSGIQSCSEFSDYPPLTGLFLAFLQPGGSPADIGLLYFGQRLLYMVLSLPVLPGWPRDKKRWYKLLLALGQAVFVLVIPGLFSEYAVYSLAPDAMMGFFVAWILVTAWRLHERGPSRMDFFQILVAILALPLCKQTGILFTLIAMIGVMLLLSHRVSLLWIGVWWLAPMASWGSWQIMCHIRGLSSYLSEGAQTAYTWEHLMQMLLHPAEWSNTLFGYLRTLSIVPVNDGPIGLSAVGFSIILAILFWRITRRKKEWKKPVQRIGIVALAGTVLFAVSLCFTYLFLFEEWEKNVFSAYTRYMSPFAAAFTLWGVYLAFRSGLFERRLRADITAAICLAVLVVSLNWQDASVLVPSQYTKIWGEYQEAQATAQDRLGSLPDYLLTCNPQEAPIVLFTMDDVFYTTYADCLNYLLAPARLQGVYREDYGVTAPPEAYGEHLRQFIEARNYNVFYASYDVEKWLPYAGATDAEGKPLETGVVYVLENDQLHRVTE